MEDILKFAGAHGEADVRDFVIGEIGDEPFVLQAVRDDDRLAEGAEDVGAVEEVAFVQLAVGAEIVERDFSQEKSLVGIHVGFGAELLEGTANHVVLH